MDKNISWVILAGGQATRMGGVDKGLQQFKNLPLFQHVLNRLLPQINAVQINANRNLKIYKKFAPVITDKRDNYQGPLSGIESSLSTASSSWVGFTPCDSPYMPSDLVQRLSRSLDDSVDVYVAYDGNKVQPVFSLWNIRALPKLTEYLNNGDRKIMLFFEKCNTKRVDFSDKPECFANFNRLEDLV